MVIAVYGLPGSGKSYFAERLSKKISAEYVNSDRLRKAMFPKRTYSRREKEAVYTAMLEKMQMAIKEKRNIVMDATFHQDQRRKALLKKLNGRDNIYFIEMKADEAVIRQRLKKERIDSDADFSVYNLLLREWEPMKEEHLLLHSTDNNIEQLLTDALKYLRKKDDKTSNR